jgi:hypothetical protein
VTMKSYLMHGALLLFAVDLAVHQLTEISMR